MTYTEEQVVAVVLEVLRRLGVATQAEDTHASAGNTPGGPAGERSAVREQPDAGRELLVAEPVVSQRLVAGRLDGVQRLVVGPRAVVTPLVRDELKRRQVELVRRSFP